MTPKQQYEARKAERAQRRAAAEAKGYREEREKAEWFELADRFVTALEEIAEAQRIMAILKKGMPNAAD